jgi:mRNA interferase RelE/StbE
VYTILITKQAKRDIDALEPVIRTRIGKKLLFFASQKNLHSVAKRLENSTIGEYRFRIGDYRVLFDLDGSHIVILRLQHRKDVYR